MAIGVDVPSPAASETPTPPPTATAFEFPAKEGEPSSPLSARLPRRLRQRLSAETKAPLTVEEIDAKLREANLRRQANARKHVDLRLRRNVIKVCRTQEHGEVLSRKLERCWRQFVWSSKTTSDLAKACEALEINERLAKSMSFEDLAFRIETMKIRQTVGALLARLEKRLVISHASGKGTSGMEDINHLLKRVGSQSRETNVPKKGTGKKPTSSSEGAGEALKHLPRYPARVVLCAYMIVGHPKAVLNGKSGCEAALAKSSARFIREFELLIRVILDGPTLDTSDSSDSATATKRCFSSQLEEFDKAWCSYLYDFVSWKVEDSKIFEEELINAACQLKISILQFSTLNEAYKSGSDYFPDEDNEQVNEGLKLIRARIEKISGNAGIERLDQALDDVRSRFIEVEKFRIPSVFSDARDASLDSVSATVNEDRVSEGQISSTANPSPSSSDLPAKSLTSTSYENEVTVNEIVHGHCGVVDMSQTAGQEAILKKKLAEIMEKAFWNALMESMKQDQPDFSWVLKLIKEVRDQLIELSPQSWREEIREALDDSTLSEEVNSGVLDVVKLRKILDFALRTLQRLASPASDGEMGIAYSKLLKEMGEPSQAADMSKRSLALSITKGLRFVLLQTQLLKAEIVKARIKLIEPLIKGPAGMEYLRKAFAEHYGLPAVSSTNLPLTFEWVSSVHHNASLEWEEHLSSLRESTGNGTMENQGLPQVTLRAGGAVSTTSRVIHLVLDPSDKEQPECRGEKIDLLLRLGLLKLVTEVEGLHLEKLPETLKLNFSRLRLVQSQLQKIIVISTSSLVLRQLLLSEASLRTEVDVEQVISDCIKQLSNLLDCFEAAGISEIVGTVGSFLEDKVEPEKIHAVIEIMANLLCRSLQAGNPIFDRVSRAVYLAARGIILGGSGQKGKQLAETALRRIGAAPLSDRLVKVIEVLIVMAVVSRGVHGQWYKALLGSL